MDRSFTQFTAVLWRTQLYRKLNLAKLNCCYDRPLAVSEAFLCRFSCPQHVLQLQNSSRNTSVWMLLLHKAHAIHHQMCLDPSSSCMGSPGSRQEFMRPSLCYSWVAVAWQPTQSHSEWSILKLHVVIRPKGRYKREALRSNSKLISNVSRVLVEVDSRNFKRVVT